MNRKLMAIGFVSGVIVLFGFLSPWLELNSAPYQFKNVRVKDNVKITGLDLLLGKLRVVQKKVWGDKLYRTVEIQIESKYYPFLDLVGGILLLLGGASTIYFKGKMPYLIILSGGTLALIGGFFGFFENRWIRHMPVIIENYVVSGYYRYGLIMCIVGSLFASIGCLLDWTISH